MTTADSVSVSIPEETRPAARIPRLAPAIALVGLYWLGRLTVNVFFPATFTQFLTLFWSPIVLAVAVLGWWLFFSRMAWIDRLWGVGCVAAAGGAATLLADKSMPMGMFMYALPMVITVVVGWLWLTRWRSDWMARLGLLAAALITWHAYTLIRIDGITGGFATQWSFRWSPTAEEQYLASLPAQRPAEAEDETPLAPEALVATPADWPGFRGADRDGVLHGVKLSPDWKAHPPKELWRRRVGPGWSSFAVIGDVAFTQEQRGEHEAVVCFDVATGNEVWVHEDEARFWEVVAGAGPRGTPTFDGGKLYTLGGSGRLNCLDAATGDVVWTRDMAADAGCSAPPQWGFASSPLVIQGVAIVLAGGDGREVLAYDALTGELKWTAGEGKLTYSSPHRWAPGGKEQVLALSDYGLEAFDPNRGEALWSHEWTVQGIFRVVQPGVLDDSRLLMGTGMGNGTRLVNVRGGDSWQAEEEWTSRDMKPYFNDYVVHDGHLYGFDHDLFACVDLASGKRQWKRGRYGQGQVLLIADSGLLLVVSEKGELVLLKAHPDKHTELGRIQALTGKTWNHPVIHGDKLLVRNSEEMACFQISLEK